ncbi:MAG: efflux transporter outer membrane subunit [Nevskia sp.]|nr:efflux transporter outer membrane subunit [Nevskia sp.]
MPAQRQQAQRTRPRSEWPRLGLAALLSALAGCANYIGVRPLQPVAQPDAFQTAHSLAGSSGDWPDADWVKRFGDPQLVTLTEEALAHNLDLQAASARITAAQAQADAARGALLPSAAMAVTANRSYLKQDLKLQTPVGPTQASSSWSNQVQTLVGFNYELDLWGKNHATLAKAVSQGKAAEAEAQQARLTLTAALASTYNQLAEQYASRDLVEQLGRQRGALAALADRRLKSGLDNQIDQSEAGESLAEAHLQLAQLDEQIALTRQQIGALMGEGPDRGLSITRPRLANLPTPPLPANISFNLLGRRPDVVAARWKVEAASSQVAVAKAEFYPNIDLSGFAGYASFGLSDVSKSYIKGFGLGPAISLPVFAGGTLNANLKGQMAQYDSAVASYNQTLNGALADVANQITSLRASDLQMQSQTQALQESRRTFDLVRQRHDAGLASDQMLANAQIALLAVQQRSADLDARRRGLQIALIKSLGGGFDAQTAGLTMLPPEPADRHWDFRPHRVDQGTK